METRNVKVYQVDIEKDIYHIQYKSSEVLKSTYTDRRDLIKIYDLVYEEDVEITNLTESIEDVLNYICDKLENLRPVGYNGSMYMNVGDIIIVDGRHWYYLNDDDFTEIS